MNVQGRPTRPETAAVQSRGTFTGNRGLNMEEALIFETGRLDATGVDIDEPEPFQSRLGPHARGSAIELPGLTEPEAIRHYVRLSRNNYSIDAGIYPLGSCTMKHNPRLNEKIARLPGFADVHPLQPVSTAQGALEVIEALAERLVDDDRHGRRRDVAEGRRARRTLRHDGDQGGDRGARRGSDAAGRAGSRFRPRHESGDRGADRLFRSFRSGGRRRKRQRRGGARRARPRRCGDHADQSQHLRTVRAPDCRHRRGRTRGGGVFLLRRRELQCRRRQDPAGRSRRRRHAHQPAQDVLDAARRRRPGRRAGRAVVAARALCAGSVRRARRRSASPGRARRRRRVVWTHVRFPRADGHVRARAQLHPVSRRRRAAGRLRRTRCCRPTTFALRSTM